MFDDQKMIGVQICACICACFLEYPLEPTVYSQSAERQTFVADWTTPRRFSGVHLQIVSNVEAFEVFAVVEANWNLDGHHGDRAA